MNHSKKLSALLAALIFTATLAACGKADPGANVDKAITSGVYALNAEERQLAETNAKQFYNKQWPAKGGDMKPGIWTECRPSDSNTNGLVTCSGFIPSQTQDVMATVTRYCGYRKELVGCSTEDTVR